MTELKQNKTIWKQTPQSKFAFHCVQSITGNELDHSKCNQDWCECVCHGEKPK